MGRPGTTVARLGAATVRNAVDQSRPRPEPARGESVAAACARERQTAIAMTAPLATTAATKPSVMSPVSGQLNTRSPTMPKRTGSGRLACLHGRRPGSRAPLEARDPPVVSSLTSERQVGGGEDREDADDHRPERRRRRASATNGTATIGSSATPRTWHCIVTAVPIAARSHQRRSPPVHARHAPASASALDSAMRFGFQMNVEFVDGGRRQRRREAGDGPGDRAPDVTGQPPHDRHGGDPGQRDEGHDGEWRVAAGQRRGRAQQVVVPGAVVHVADRGRRPEQRHDAVLDQKLEA